ncbi:MAG: hypothetical protein JW871_05535 [Endomicrobiales bacterium]|nr:hypothetical protein [Endomicrobiales bacterium]
MNERERKSIKFLKEMFKNNLEESIGEMQTAKGKLDSYENTAELLSDINGTLHNVEHSIELTKTIIGLNKEN